MVVSAIAIATIPPATSSTRTMLPLRRAGSWAVNGSRDGSLSGSAVIQGDAACRHGCEAIYIYTLAPECLNRTRKRKSVKRLFGSLRAFPAYFLAAIVPKVTPGGRKARA